ncbi:MAG: alpha/beta hydrolase [Blautia sp.]|nr:alpha/beta hydrolase [Blautia sp.]
MLKTENKMGNKEVNTYDFLHHIQRVDFYEKNLHYLPLVYYGQEHPRQYMECFYKDGCENMPVIIWIHGGAWDDEFLTSSYRPESVLAELAEKGYFIACLEYRLARHKPLPACLEDCQMAIEYLRENAGKYHIDPRKIGLWGESAGAHIACMAGSNYNNKNIMPVQGIVSFYCPSDLVEMLEEQNGDPGFLVNVLPDCPLTEKEQKQILEKMSPVHYADKKSIPPILLLHGDQDEVVACRQSCEYKTKLENAGNDAELIIVPGQGHGFFHGKMYYEKVIEFFQKNVSGKSA